MVKNILVAALAFVVIVSAVSAGKMQGRDHKGVKGAMSKLNATCKGEIFDMKAEMKAHMECVQEIFPRGSTTPSSATDEDKKKMFENHMKEIKDNACVSVCTMKKAQILNADGTYNSDATDKHIRSSLPASVQSDMKKAFDDCATENSKSFSMDNKCNGYLKFRDCTHKKFMEICEMKPHKAGHKHGKDQPTEN